MSKSLHPSEPRGYFGLVFWAPKYPGNLGAALRSAVVFGAKFAIIAGDRYRRDRGDVVNAVEHIPIWNCPLDMETVLGLIPPTCAPVVVELGEDHKPLPHVNHPVNAAYIFGPEDGSVPAGFLHGHQRIQIPGAGCLNLAVAASIVLYDRSAKRARLYRREQIKELALVS